VRLSGNGAIVDATIEPLLIERVYGPVDDIHSAAFIGMSSHTF
jgi:hypothetical protein